MLVAFIVSVIAVPVILLVVFAITELRRRPKVSVQYHNGRPYYQSEPDPGALSIAPADGYQYGDDHPWTPEDQHRLALRLERLQRGLAEAEDQPSETEDERSDQDSV